MERIPEDTMTNPTFEPVNILIGLGFPVTIRNVFMAYRIVTEWTGARQGRAYQEALSACRSALNGGDPREARAAFVAFARSTGILVEDAAPLVAANSTTKLPMSA
jgi:hypothetical protein